MPRDFLGCQFLGVSLSQAPPFSSRAHGFFQAGSTLAVFRGEREGLAIGGVHENQILLRVEKGNSQRQQAQDPFRPLGQRQGSGSGHSIYRVSGNAGVAGRRAWSAARAAESTSTAVA